MLLKNKQFRCSQLHLLIGQSKGKDILSQTAKSTIRTIVKEDLYGYKSFTGSKYTEKGKTLEDEAIYQSGLFRFKEYHKNFERISNDLITGECDVADFDDKIILDTKCTWDIGTHPFFKDEAAEKVKKAGYDIQIQGYIKLWEEKYKMKFSHGLIHFHLIECPEELLKPYDDRGQLIDIIYAIPREKRITEFKVERDQAVMDRIDEIIPHAQRFYKLCMMELMGDDYE